MFKETIHSRSSFVKLVSQSVSNISFAFFCIFPHCKSEHRENGIFSASICMSVVLLEKAAGRRLLKETVEKGLCHSVSVA